jgi:hypothetical protein
MGSSGAFTSVALSVGALIVACGGLSESESTSGASSGLCPRLCAWQEACGSAAARCNDECAWLDGSYEEGSSRCYPFADRMFDCLQAEPERVACSVDGVTVDLAGCQGHELAPLCPGSVVTGGVEVILADTEPPGACAVDPLQERVGRVEPGALDAPLQDGTQQFLWDLRYEQVTIRDQSIRCQIIRSDQGFEFSLRARSGETSFEAEGLVDGVGEGTAQIVLQVHDQPALYSDLPCIIEVRRDVPHAQALSESYIWADFRCEALAAATNEGPTCQGNGTFLFEYCSTR